MEDDLTTTPENETRAMHELAGILGRLDPLARYRAWLWAGQRSGFLPMPQFGQPETDDPIARLFGRMDDGNV